MASALKAHLDEPFPSDAVMEKQLFDDFLVKNAHRYDFGSEEHQQLLVVLASQRFLGRDQWQRLQPNDHKLRVLKAMRVLLRDERNRVEFSRLGGVQVLCRVLGESIDEHFSPTADETSEYNAEMLVEMLSVLKRYADSDDLLGTSQDSHARSPHECVSLLLHSQDPLVLQCALVALCELSRRPAHATLIAELECTEILVRILADYESAFKVLAIECLDRLAHEELIRRKLLASDDNLSVLLSLLHAADNRLQLLVITTLETLSAHEDCLRELRQLGGLHIALSLLSPLAHTLRAGQMPSARSPDTPSPGPQLGAGGGLGQALPPAIRSRSSSQSWASTPLTPSRLLEPAEWPLQVASSPMLSDDAEAKGDKATSRELGMRPGHVVVVLSLLARLAADNENAMLLRKANAVYVIGQFITAPAVAGGAGVVRAALPTGSAAGEEGLGSKREEGGERDEWKRVQAAAFRALRCLFSTERIRRVFKRLFPPDMFCMFIDVGHYVHRLEAYSGLVEHLGKLTPEALGRMREALDDVNVVKGPSQRVIQGYTIQETLGAGAFGTVYQVTKVGPGGGEMAMKILPLEVVLGSGAVDEEGDEEAGVIREAAILSTLAHTNIIRYYDSFVLDGSLHIVTELVDGATLLDHITALAEKGERFSEEQVWSIFVQMVLALRHCHKDVGVVHRDLTPSNVLLTADGEVKVADFGLARKHEASGGTMSSVVGTILYHSPELVKHEVRHGPGASAAGWTQTRAPCAPQGYTEKVDIWALGCLLYQLAMLRPPFSGSNPLAVAQQVVDGTFDALDARWSPLMNDVLNQCLQVKEQDRPDVDGVARIIAPLLVRELDRSSASRRELLGELVAERERRIHFEREAARAKDAVHRFFVSQQCSAGGAAGVGVGRPSREASPEAARPAADSIRRRPVAPLVPSTMAATLAGPGARALGDMPGLDRPPAPNAVNRLRRRSSEVVPGDSREASPLRRVGSSSGVTSRSAMLSISPNRIREINDPASLLLNQLHKLLFVCQLPPALAANHVRARAMRASPGPLADPRPPWAVLPLHRAQDRHLIERYKRLLFSHRPGASPRSLKDELHKLLKGSQERVYLGLNHDASNPANPSRTGLGADAAFTPLRDGAVAWSTGPEDQRRAPGGQRYHVSYEELQQMIEQVLAGTGYYTVLRSSTPFESQSHTCPASPTAGAPLLGGAGGGSGDATAPAYGLASTDSLPPLNIPTALRSRNSSGITLGLAPPSVLQSSRRMARRSVS